MGCNNHNPVQHRDGKPPWCDRCGLTAGFNKPRSLFDKKPEVFAETDELLDELTPEEIRLACLELAVDWSTGFDTSAVVRIAKQFEQYVLGDEG